MEAGHTEVAKLLIERGADTSNTDGKDNSLAELAAKHCSLDILQLLPDKRNVNLDKLEDGETLLTSATYREDFDTFTVLLEKGADVNARNRSGDTALSCVLQFAPRSRAMELAKLLISHGADVHMRNDRGENPLQIACSINLDKIAEFLLELGCEPNVKNNFSYSPLHHATQNNNGKLVET